VTVAMTSRVEDEPAAGSDTREDEAPPGCRPDCPLRTGHALLLDGLTFAELERRLYLFALRNNDGSRRKAAKALGISRSTFCDRLKRLGMPVDLGG
jgi:DNA-binding NtrC family response regulator